MHACSDAPTTFQRLVNKVLAGVLCCDACLDDIVVCSVSWAEHISKLREVFIQLRDANLTLNLAKCEFGQATIVYLGKSLRSFCFSLLRLLSVSCAAFGDGGLLQNFL